MKNNEEFLEKVEFLLSLAVRSKTKRIRTYGDVRRLYSGSAVGGYFPPTRAIQNLKQSFVVLKIPITREIGLTFKDLQEYADFELKDYSIYPWGYKQKVITFPVPYHF